MSPNRLKLVSFAAVLVAAVLFGMVIAGGLNLTPAIDAQARVERAPVPDVSAVALPDFAALADRVVPSVVSVLTTDVRDSREPRRMPMDPFHFFFDQRRRDGGRDGEEDEPDVRESSGSGFFISPDGEVLTNNHVVEDADKLRIELADGTQYEVEVVGRDPATDLAVVRVAKPDREFPALRLGDSQAVRVGEWVMAVGNPLNMEHTVTVGVVSAKGRRLGLSSDSSFENFIQTDAAINFGNSGGPLVNLRGEVIGINTAINVRGQNLGFAVPSDVANLVIPQLRATGKVTRGYLGVTVRDVDRDREEAWSLPSRKGAFVEGVTPGHAGAKAGLEPGDVIVKLNGVEILDTRDLIDRVSANPPGTSVTLDVLRGGKAVTLKATLEERGAEDSDDESAPGEAKDDDVSERVGITVAELTPRARQYYGVPDTLEGVLVTKVKRLSPAGEKGMVEGDVITEVNGRPIVSADELMAQIRAVDEGAYLRLYVFRPRAEQSFFVVLKLE